MGHLNIGPVYRVGQVEIEHSSKTSLFQETEGEISRGKSTERVGFQTHCGTVFSELPGASPLDPLGAHNAPRPQLN